MFGHKDLIVKRTATSAAIYFKNSSYHPKKDQIDSYLRQNVFRNHCSNGDTSLFSHGEVRISFNPVVHDCKMRKRVTDGLVALIVK